MVFQEVVKSGFPQLLYLLKTDTVCFLITKQGAPMYKRTSLFSVASIALLASIAQADNNPQQPIKTHSSGFYVSGGAGAAFLMNNFETYWEDQVVLAAYPTVRLDAGYKFNPYFALGVDSYLLNLKYDGGHRVIAPTSLYAKGIIPLSDRWNLYGKLGLGSYIGIRIKGHNNTKYLSPLLSAAVGANYMLTHSLAVGAEFGGAVLSFTVPALTANLTYYFGS